MDPRLLPDNPYLLLTPGPLSTSKAVKAAMFRDWCTWDDDYNALVRGVRAELVRLAGGGEDLTAVLMQGSGTFCVEAVIGTAVPRGGKLLVLANGAYGLRIGTIAERLGIPLTLLDFGELDPPGLSELALALEQDPAIGHVAVVHCETTSGMLNPVAEIGRLVKQAGKTFIVDAMSSFGGIPMDMADIGADFLISSANKCIEGVPGFGFVVARRGEMERLAGRARSLSLDLYDQWRVMEDAGGKWRFTSPTHVVRAFCRALEELAAEGGVTARHARYVKNQAALVSGMTRLGFECLLPGHCRSPIITAFHNPQWPGFTFRRFYDVLKDRGFVIYPGKVSRADTFRIGTIGQVFPEDMERLVEVVAMSGFAA
ncbi:MAG: 2-aminoethylphosphonate--pyruvate transaminase [Desulfovibrio sp.]|nr:2-aminoethylphosphonate--pyruvate transaminase [Desulfovibrio sp.]